MIADPKEILLKYWSYSRFRPLQEDIITSVTAGTDTLALLPTGGGKSVCYQVPALSMEGLCLVISPLIALMKDQVEQLKQKGIPASAIYSGLSKDETDIILDNCSSGYTRLLYLSPERLLSESFRDRLRGLKLSFIAVDEAHCISQWGYDFRPSYLRISEVRDMHPNVPIAAFTATATSETRKDIIQKLGLRKPSIFAGSFHRQNLAYLVYKSDDKMGMLIDLLSRIKGSAVVYARNRKGTSDVAKALTQRGISADFYHAGLPMPVRNNKQDDWIRNRVRVMVATNAFGMGIDKPDVRLVVHMDIPDSLEDYYQEAGRAGRDGKKSYAVLLYQEKDLSELEARPDINYPPVQEIRKVYTAICNYLSIPVGGGEGVSHDFELTRFFPAFQLPPLPTLNCLRVLETEGLISLSEGIFIPSRIHFPGNQEDLYRFRVENIRFDPLIKAILRSTEGAFDTYAAISEGDLARKTGIRTEELVRTLLYLDKLGVLRYQPRKDAPQLTLTIPRIPSEHIEFDYREYEKRKQVYLERIRSVVQYASSTDQCRSVMLLEYFGESSRTRCGTCDYCRNRNKLDLNEMEFEKHTSAILKILASGPAEIAAITSLTAPDDREKVIETVRWLLDRGKLKMTSEGKLEPS